MKKAAEQKVTEKKAKAVAAPKAAEKTAAVVKAASEKQTAPKKAATPRAEVTYKPAVTHPDTPLPRENSNMGLVFAALQELKRATGSAIISKVGKKVDTKSGTEWYVRHLLSDLVRKGLAERA